MGQQKRRNVSKGCIEEGRERMMGKVIKEGVT